MLNIIVLLVVFNTVSSYQPKTYTSDIRISCTRLRSAHTIHKLRYNGIIVEDAATIDTATDQDEHVDSAYQMKTPPVWLNVVDTLSSFPSPALVGVNIDTISSTYKANSVVSQLPFAWQPVLNAWKSIPGDGGLAVTTIVTKDSVPIPCTTQHTILASTTVIDDPNSPPVSLSDYLNGGGFVTKVHQQNIDIMWSQVKNHGKMKYLTHDEARLIKEALKVAYLGLWGKQTFRSLESSTNRARGTAAVLGELKVGMDVILTGILHDVMYQLSLTAESNKAEFLSMYNKLTSMFGVEVISLCEKYIRLPKFMARKTVYTLQQSENQIQMLVTVAEDYNVLYIRLADRIHTLRVLLTLPLKEQERIKIAQEAIAVYAPLAHKMGVGKVKGEMEDLAFRALDPQLFQQTRYTQAAANKAYHDAATMIDELVSKDEYLSSLNATYRLTYRIKDKYQLMLKMQRKFLKSCDEVKDILGLRIIMDYKRSSTDSDEEYIVRGNSICYHLLNRLRKVPEWEATSEYKDYIAYAKETGYKSLHQYLRNTATGTNVEVQIRTKEMHYHAELGSAAHWYYKDLTYRHVITESKVYRAAWRAPGQAAAKSPEELIKMAKQQLLASRVYIFLDDQSTVLNLKKDATALDAAFAIHSNVGLSTKSILVNGSPIQFNGRLKTGDVLSVEQVEDGMPYQVSPMWMNFLNSSSAQATLRKYFRDNHRYMMLCLGFGRLLLTLTLNSELIRKRYEKSGRVPDINKIVKYAAARSGLTNIAELLVLLGTAKRDVAALYIGRLLDIPAAQLNIASIQLGIAWVRSQSKRPTDTLFQSAVKPMISDVLVDFGADAMLLEKKWCELAGIASLDKMPAATTTTTEIHPNATITNHASEDVAAVTTVASPFKHRTTDTENSYLEYISSLSSPALVGVSLAISKKMSIEEAVHYNNYRKAKVQNRTAVVIARNPYSLQAPALTPSLLKFARDSFAEKHLSKYQ